MSRKLEFTVTICLGHGDGGDICVEVEVTNKEYKLLKKCCAEGDDIDFFEGLEDLYNRIIAEARAESEFFDPEDCDIDYDNADYGVEMPDEIYDAVEDE
jgi:hypothetical protein